MTAYRHGKISYDDGQIQGLISLLNLVTCAFYHLGDKLNVQVVLLFVIRVIRMIDGLNNYINSWMLIPPFFNLKFKRYNIYVCLSFFKNSLKNKKNTHFQLHFLITHFLKNHYLRTHCFQISLLMGIKRAKYHIHMHSSN